MNYRIADVAYVEKARWDRTPGDGYFEGAPEIVPEVLAVSDIAFEMLTAGFRPPTGERRSTSPESGFRSRSAAPSTSIPFLYSAPRLQPI